MTQSELIVRVALEGAILAVPLIVAAFLLSRFTRDVYGRALLAIFLFVAAGAYVGFAILGRDALGTPGVWALVEIGQVVVIGGIGLLGLRGSPNWLALGWALHPFWDVLLHYLGPGDSFTPWTYAIACVGFDWLVAAYIVLAYRFGLVGDRRSQRREAARQPAAG